MDLVDRYLHAVRGYLPTRVQNDIVRELAEDIHAQLGDREAELGRPLERADVTAFLQHLGHPMVLAARFRPQQQLIGPTVFPFYWWTLGLALAVASLVHLVLAAVLLATDGSQRAIDMLVGLPFNTAVTVFGWVTLVFAVGDWGLRRTQVLVAWDPRSLPPVPVNVARISRVTSFLEVVGAAAFLAWLAVLPIYPWLVFGPAASFLTFGPAWTRIYPALIALAAASLAVPIVALVRPDLTRVRALGKIATSFISLMVFSVLIDGGPLVVLRDGTPQADYVEGARAINIGVRIFMVVGWMMSAIDLVRAMIRFYRERPRPQGASNA